MRRPRPPIKGNDSRTRTDAHSRTNGAAAMSVSSREALRRVCKKKNKKKQTISGGFALAPVSMDIHLRRLFALFSGQFPVFINPGLSHSSPLPPSLPSCPTGEEHSGGCPRLP